MVNVAAWQRANLEKTCRAAGTNLKDQARNAVLNIERDLRSGFKGGGFIGMKLTECESRALEFFVRKFRGQSPASVAGSILRLALARPSVVQAWMDATASYCAAEDVELSKFLIDSVARQPRYKVGKAVNR